MKKTLWLVLVFVLILGSIPFALTETTAGEKLAELGLVEGDTQGNLLEDEKLTRAQMMVMLARLNGVEAEAEDFEKSDFSDVKDDSYYSPFIAYAYDKGWTKGTSEETFSPEAEVNGQMVATFMLRVLGYKGDWKTAVAEAALLGIMDNNLGEPFLRKNAFDMIYDAVNTKLSGEDILLGEKLGVGKALRLKSVEAIKNTTIELTFSSKIDKETVEASLFKISEYYGDKESLEILEIDVHEEVITLTVKSMKNILYKIQLGKGLMGVYGNSLDLEDKVKTFVGKAIADKIDEMTIRRLSDRQIAVIFNEHIAKSAEERLLYVINGGIENPDRVRKATVNDQIDHSVVVDYMSTVILDIPKTNSGQVYTLKVMKGFENIDGVQTTEILTGTFIGAGITSELPKIEDVIATDSQTLKIYFDRSITDESIDGRIWDSENRMLYLPNILAVDATGNNEINDSEDFDLYDSGKAYAYQSSILDRVLIVRLESPSFSETHVTASDNNYNLVGNPMYLYSEENANILEFSYNNDEVTHPRVEGVVMLDEQTIEVYFSEEVRINALDEIKIYKNPNSAINNTILTGIKSIYSKNNIVWTMGLNEPINPRDVNDDKAYFYIPDGSAKDITGTVNAMAPDTEETYQSLAFSMNYEEAKSIKDVFAKMPDSRTIKVIYPEAMKGSDVIDVSNYALLDMDSNSGANELNGVDFKIDYASYDKESYTATLYLNTSITAKSDTGNYFLAIDGLVENELNTKTITDEYTSDLQGVPSNRGLVFQFAESTKEPAKPIIESVKVSDDRFTVTIQFNEEVAFVDADNAFDLMIDLTRGLTKVEFLEALSIKGRFENEISSSPIEVSDISSVEGVSVNNEKKIKVIFNKKLAVDSSGTITTEDKTSNKIFNRKSAYAAVDDKTSKVTFGVSTSLYSDGRPPLLKVNTSYGSDDDSDGKLDRVTLVYDENMKLTETLDTNAKAKTLIRELTVNNGTIDADLTEGMMNISVEANKVVIALDNSVVGTGTVMVSIDADTSGLNGQLQDTSILKASDQKTIVLDDKVQPVLIEAAAEVDSEAIGLLFSEKVSGGTPDVLENITADDLMWQDVSGDGANFIKFILTSKNKSRQGIVVDKDIIVNDIGKDQIKVKENSVFDASGNPVLATPIVISR